jgi:hypothetical protein
MAASLSAQPYVTEQHKSANIYYNSENAAMQMFGDRLLFSEVSVGSEFSEGSLHRPQQPGRSNGYLFSTEGSVYLGKAYVSGGFDFKQAFDKDTQFNSVFDPYRGTPYIIADSTGGDWRKQSYVMWSKITGQIVEGKLFYGLKMDLDVGRGAKVTDPRPQANSNRIEFTPSLAAKLGEHHGVGASFNYARFQENSNLMLYDTGNPQKLYLLKGMGQYTYVDFTTVEWIRKYGGNQFGFGGYYSYDGGKIALLATGEYKNYVEDASDIDNNKPRLRGRFFQTEYLADIKMTVRGENALHVISGGYTATEQSGREFIQRYDASPEVNSWVTESQAPRRSVVDKVEAKAGYRIMFAPERDFYRWSLSVDGDYEDFSDGYAVLDSYMKYRSSMATVSAERVIDVRKTYFAIGLGVFGRTVWNEAMNYTFREEDHTIGDGLIAPDYSILTSDFAGAKASLTAGYKFDDGRSLWLKAGYSYVDAGRLIRHNAVISLGYSF